jgi:hypothetical protein
MRRAASIAALAAALALSGAAAAATTGYSGSIKSGTVNFKVIRKSGKRKLTGFKFMSVPVTCRAGGATASGRDTADRFPIRPDGFFKLVLKSDNPAFTGKVVFKGAVTRGSASGTFRLSGKKVPIEPAATGRNCDTGVLDWSAQSG